jgi:hypothetical protein
MPLANFGEEPFNGPSSYVWWRGIDQRGVMYRFMLKLPVRQKLQRGGRNGSKSK